MAVFQYEAMNQAGQEVKDNIDASSAEDALEKIRNLGLFPTRIRYTSMSLQYHLGNGWFGGLLPPMAFAIVAQTGDIYSGLWYPVLIAGATAVIGSLYLRETCGVDMYADD